MGLIKHNAARMDAAKENILIMQAKIQNLEGKTAQIAKALLWEATWFLPETERNPAPTPGLEELLGLDKAPLKSFFCNESQEYHALEALAGKDNAALARQVWNRTGLYPCGWRQGWASRSNSSHNLTRQALSNLEIFISMLLDGFSLETWLQHHENPNQKHEFLSDNGAMLCVAAVLDGNNSAAAQMLARMEAIIFDESGQCHTSESLLESLLMCENDQAIALAGKLLLEAKLSEGLRSTLLKHADAGTLKAFRHMTELIHIHNLSRFASVVQAFYEWGGFKYGELDPKKIKQLLETTWACQTDKTFRQNCLNGEDPLAAYLALWITALESQEQVTETIESMLNTGTRMQKLAALMGTLQLHAHSLRYRLLRPLLDNPAFTSDKELLVWVLYGCKTISYCLGNTPNLGTWSNAPAALSWADTVAYYSSLQKLLPKAEGKGKNRYIRPSFMAGVEMVVSLTDIITVQCQLLHRKNRQSPEQEQADRQFNADFETFKTRWNLSTDLVWCRGRYEALQDDLDQPLEPDCELLSQAGNQTLSLRDVFCLQHAGMPAELRTEMLYQVLGVDISPMQRQVLVQLLADKDQSVSDAAWDKALGYPFSKAEIAMLENFLRLKNGTLRQRIAIKILLDLEKEPQQLEACVESLCSAKDPMRRQAGEELRQVINRQDGGSAEKMPPETAPDMAATPRLVDMYHPGNGFGLFNPALPPQSMPLPEMPQHLDVEGFFSEPGGVDGVLAKILRIFDKIRSVMEENRLFAYKDMDQGGHSYDRLLGHGILFPVSWPTGLLEWQLGLECYPLAEQWQRIFDEESPSPRLLHFLKGDYALRLESGSNQASFWHSALSGGEDFHRLVVEIERENNKAAKTAWRVRNTVIQAWLSRRTPVQRYRDMRDYYLWILSAKDRVPQEKMQSYQSCLGSVEEWLYAALWTGYGNVFDPPSADNQEWTTCFSELFYIRYYCFSGKGSLRFNEMVWGHKLRLLPEEEWLRLLIKGLRNEACYFYPERFTDVKLADQLEKLSPGLPALVDKVVQRAADLEKERGELPTESSFIVGGLQSLPGTRHFVDLLECMGKEPYERSYSEYGVSRTATRKAMLSHLLRRSCPAKGENAATLKALLQGRKVSTRQLVEGALFAPQWIDTVSAFLDWPGLESACWYFQAHVNEAFSAEKETCVARFSQITPQEFNDGAFDIAWFNQAYAALGDERFQMVYEAAKYLNNGGGHKRAQLFADALRGRLLVADAEQAITQKRNLNHVLCYGLIPVNEKNSDALHRYDVLQRFRRESRAFGAARQASENRAVDMAVNNLARNAGYADTVRFIWAMEGEKYRSFADCLAPRAVGEAGNVEIWLDVDEKGQPHMQIRKQGKMQKSLPAAVRKDAHVLDVKNAEKELRLQQSRARADMERAMERGWAFTAAEIRALAVNPVLGPLLRHLVFMQPGNPVSFGFPAELPLNNENAVFVPAHALHLQQAGVWSQWQKRLFDQGIVQPFKQVFRELYLPVAAELEAGSSRRYAGHQVRARRGAGLLKNRGWTVNYYEGLQKVFHQENLIACIFAFANWFSPAEVEEPALEDISFYCRTTGAPVLMKDVPPVLFSEVMRDVDLLVSVANATGVEVETGAATLEMRKALASETIRLLRLENVSFAGPRAVIKGKRGEYTVHLGSGTVFCIGYGALPVSTVFSQQRGRVFLPFADDDPLTADVLSKIICLAEDEKIKDPSFWNMLRLVCVST